MSKIYKTPPHCKGLDDHQKYLSRITKTLYYGKLPKNDMLSLPVTELAVEIFSEAQKGRSLDRLHINAATQISRNACVSPCSLVLAMLYFERLKKCNVDYLERTMPSDLFLVSLMVSSKFLFDDGEIDEVFMDEWAASSGLTSRELAQLERDFLKAINWELYASEPAFWNKLSEIEVRLAIKEGRARGHFTYTELHTLGNVISKDFQNILHCIIAISIILAAAYTAAILTLVGSVALASNIPGTSLYKNPISISNKFSLAEDLMVKENATLNVPMASSQPKKHVNFNVVKVFKASILLASLKSDSLTNLTMENVNDGCENCQQITWDWWNIPIMTWLSKASEFVKNFEMPAMQNYIFYLESAVSNGKFVYLEDHIHKATKTRIQDQMERSWHVEWSDTIKRHFAYYNVLPYLRSIKP